MSYKGNSQKPPRKDCAYSEEEMEQLRPFKEDYKTAGQEERLIIMKTRILPTIFNYWTAQGKRPTQEEGPGKAKVNGTVVLSALMLTPLAATGKVVRKQLAHVSEGCGERQALAAEENRTAMADKEGRRRGGNCPASGGGSDEAMDRRQTGGTV